MSYAVQTENGPSETVAVNGVNLVVEPGSTVGMAGESGCGKSTLAMSVLRLLPGNATLGGQVLLDGEAVNEMTWGRLRAVRWTEAAIVFQGAMHSLNPVRRVRDQIAEALFVHAKDLTPDFTKEPTRLARVAELLAQVDLPAAKGSAFPHELSGGQKQRVMIAMALACDPALIIADEPTTALDVIVQAQVLGLLTRLVRERGLSLVLISHDLSVLAATCDRIVVMQKGSVVEDGPSAEVMRNPQHPHTQALASAFPLVGDRASRRILPGYDATDAAGRAPGDVVLEARDLSVHFASGTTSVDRVSLSCRRGEIVALVGQSGSGKTTLARTLLGLQQASSGDVLFDGACLERKRASLTAFRRCVQFVLQDPTAALNPKQTVYEAVAEGARIHRLPGDERELVCAALRKAGLNPPERYLSAIPQELSGGERQRVVIAGALALDPEFLVADEPVASLDASVRAEILALLLRLRSELGLGALVITHDLGLAWNIADRVVVMFEGRIVEEGPVEDVLLNPQHEYTRRLLSVVPTLDADQVS
ncbi:ABC transporter ATP-binding protein [Cryobacterium roopkundense]|uniref:Peptide/nickel transport system ATP-binding protein n=2 Tax=Cryobacterium roopkundense TaxID=1001240 RepID=A0A7W9E6C5_9MICO|nr:peptide/nickel transport system ATP-binding protein [Cryobacterium roopkundense]